MQEEGGAAPEDAKSDHGVAQAPVLVLQRVAVEVAHYAVHAVVILGGAVVKLRDVGAGASHLLQHAQLLR